LRTEGACGKIDAMSKIAKYLNGHILGEVSARESRLKQFSTDRSILKIEPKVVIYPRIAEDIRKVMRFSWQLAEKGYIFGITADQLSPLKMVSALNSRQIRHRVEVCFDRCYGHSKDFSSTTSTWSIFYCNSVRCVYSKVKVRTSRISSIA
jgi:hypothetical protein